MACRHEMIVLARDHFGWGRNHMTSITRVKETNCCVKSAEPARHHHSPNRNHTARSVWRILQICNSLDGLNPAAQITRLNAPVKLLAFQFVSHAKSLCFLTSDATTAACPPASVLSFCPARLLPSEGTQGHRRLVEGWRAPHTAFCCVTCTA